MRPLMFTLSLSSALALSACAGGVSGSFRGKGGQAGPPVAPSAVKVVASKADMTGSYTELGIAKGSAPTAQQAVDHYGWVTAGEMLVMSANAAPTRVARRVNLGPRPTEWVIAVSSCRPTCLLWFGQLS